MPITSQTGFIGPDDPVVKAPKASRPFVGPDSASESQGFVGPDESSSIETPSVENLPGIAPGTKPSSVLRRAVADPLLDLASGLIAVPKSFVGLGSIATGGRVGKAVDTGMSKAGLATLSESGEFWQGLKSPEAKEAQRRVSEADGFTGKITEAVSNPSTIGSAVIQSVPGMLAGGGAARVATKLIPKLAPIAMGLGEGAIGAGAAAESIRESNSDKLLTLKQSALSAAAGAGTAALGVLGGKLAAKLKIVDPDTWAAGMATPQTALPLWKRVIGGAVSEGLFEELPQSVQEQMLQNEAMGRPIMEGVAENAAMGLLAGTAMGGGANIPSRAQVKPPATPQTPPSITPIPTPAPAPVAPVEAQATPPVAVQEDTAPTYDQQAAQFRYQDVTAQVQDPRFKTYTDAGYTRAEAIQMVAADQAEEAGPDPVAILASAGVQNVTPEAQAVVAEQIKAHIETGAPIDHQAIADATGQPHDAGALADAIFEQSPPLVAAPPASSPDPAVIQGSKGAAQGAEPILARTQDNAVQPQPLPAPDAALPISPPESAASPKPGRAPILDRVAETEAGETVSDARLTRTNEIIAAQSTKERAKIADKYDAKSPGQGDSWRVPSKPEEFTKWSKHLIDAIDSKDADYLRSTLSSPDLNEGSRLAFTELTGVKMPKTKRDREVVIDQWAGVTPEERARRDGEKKAKFDDEQRAKDLDRARSAANAIQSQAPDGAKIPLGEFVDSIFEKGFNRVIQSGKKGATPVYSIVNEENSGYPINHPAMLRYARAKEAMTASASTPTPLDQVRTKVKASVAKREGEAEPMKFTREAESVPSEPLWHGTKYSGNDIRAGGGKDLHGQGIWFTAQKGYTDDQGSPVQAPADDPFPSVNASEYAVMSPGTGKPRLVRAKLTIKNPAKIFDTDIAKSGITVDQLKVQGFDGAHMLDTGAWVAFDPEQVKVESEPSSGMATLKNRIQKAQIEPEWRDGGTLSQNADGMWVMDDDSINPQSTAKEAAASIVDVEPTSHVAIRRIKGTNKFKVQVAEWDADEPDASNPRILDFRDVEAEPPAPVESKPAKAAWEMTGAEFEQAVKRGKIVQATGKDVPGEESAKTPLKMGELNGYSPDDIAHFYAKRRGYPNSVTADYDPIVEGRKELVTDALREGKPVPGEVIDELGAKIEKPLTGIAKIQEKRAANAGDEYFRRATMAQDAEAMDRLDEMVRKQNAEEGTRFPTDKRVRPETAAKLDTEEIKDRMPILLAQIREVAPQQPEDFDARLRNNFAIYYAELKKRGKLEAELPGVEAYLATGVKPLTGAEKLREKVKGSMPSSESAQEGRKQAALETIITYKDPVTGKQLKGSVRSMVDRGIEAGWRMVVVQSGFAFVGPDMQGVDKKDIGAYGMEYASEQSDKAKQSASPKSATRTPESTAQGPAYQAWVKTQKEVFDAETNLRQVGTAQPYEVAKGGTIEQKRHAFNMGIADAKKSLENAKARSEVARQAMLKEIGLSAPAEPALSLPDQLNAGTAAKPRDATFVRVNGTQVVPASDVDTLKGAGPFKSAEWGTKGKSGFVPMGGKLAEVRAKVKGKNQPVSTPTAPASTEGGQSSETGFQFTAADSLKLRRYERQMKAAKDSGNGEAYDEAKDRYDAVFNKSKQAPSAEEPPVKVAEKKAAPVKVETDAQGDVTVSVPKADKPGLPAKEQKKYLLAEIDRAIEGASDEKPMEDSAFGNAASARKIAEENTRTLGTVTIEVPNDGTFKVLNSKPALEAFRKAVSSQFPTSVPAASKPVAYKANKEIYDQNAFVNVMVKNPDMIGQYETQIANQTWDEKDAESVKDAITEARRLLAENNGEAIPDLSEYQKDAEAKAVDARIFKALEAMKASPKYDALRQAAKVNYDAQPESTRDEWPKNGDMLNFMPEGRGAPAIRKMQDELAKDLGLNRAKPVKGRYTPSHQEFDLSRYWKDVAEEYTPSPESEESQGVIGAENLRLVSRLGQYPDTAEGKDRTSQTPAVIETREPWQMTREEYGNRILTRQTGTGEGIEPTIGYRDSSGDEWVDTGVSGSNTSRGSSTVLQRVSDGSKREWPMTEVVRMAKIPIGHKDLVRIALAANKPVPPEVLKDYPELTAPAATMSGNEKRVMDWFTANPGKNVKAFMDATEMPIPAARETIAALAQSGRIEVSEPVTKADDVHSGVKVWEVGKMPPAAKLSAKIRAGEGKAEEPAAAPEFATRSEVESLADQIEAAGRKPDADNIRQDANRFEDRDPHGMNTLREYAQMQLDAVNGAEVAAPGVSPSDIPLDVATRAHNGTSMTPEVRGRMEQREYFMHMNRVWRGLLKLANTPEKKATAQAEFSRYRDNYSQKNLELLGSHSRLVSSMIAGPSKFPARQMNKRGDAYGNRLNEFVEWDKRAQAAMENAISPKPSRVISSDDADAVEKLKEKIAQAETLQEKMKAANIIIRDKKLSADEKVKRMVDELGFRESTARKALEPDFAGRQGFPAYELTNNSANIRRMQERVTALERSRAQKPVEVEDAATGIRIEDNVADNRLRIFFPGKPDGDVRTKLKMHGFKWAPSEGAWQRFRGTDATYWAEQITGVKIKTRETPQGVAMYQGFSSKKEGKHEDYDSTALNRIPSGERTALLDSNKPRLQRKLQSVTRGQGVREGGVREGIDTGGTIDERRLHTEAFDTANQVAQRYGYDVVPSETGTRSFTDGDEKVVVIDTAGQNEAQMSVDIPHELVHVLQESGHKDASELASLVDHSGDTVKELLGKYQREAPDVLRQIVQNAREKTRGNQDEMLKEVQRVIGEELVAIHISEGLFSGAFNNPERASKLSSRIRSEIGREGKSASYRTASEPSRLSDANARSIVRRILGPSADVTIVDRIFENGAFRLGKYQAGMTTIARRGDMDRTAFHEAYHGAEDMLFTDAERSRVEELEPDAEKRADAFMEYAADHNSVTGKLRGLFDRLMYRIKALFGKAGKLDELKALHARIMGGGMANRSAEAVAGSPAMARETPAPFYSALLRAVESIPGDQKMPAQQFLLRIKGLGNKGYPTKQQEIEESGLADWLKMRQENGQSVTKADAVEFLKGNGIQLEVLTKGLGEITAAKTFAGYTDDQLRKHLIDNFYADPDDAGKMTRAEMEQFADDNAETDLAGDNENAPKYAQYAPPGGVPGTYREVLLTVPSTDDDIKLVSEKQTGSRMWDFTIERNGKVRQVEGVGSDRESAYRDMITRVSNKSERDFYSTHWPNTPNVLAHMLMDERRIPLDVLARTQPELAAKLRAQGKTEARALHMIEGQSDLHAAGQSKGYRKTVQNDVSEFTIRPFTEKDLEYDAVRYAPGGHNWIVAYDSGMPRIAFQYKHEAENYIKKQAETVVNPEGPPSLPMKGDAWKRLVIRKMLSEAVKGDYDLLTWSTGADRAAKWGSERVEWKSKAPQQQWTIFDNAGSAVGVGVGETEQEAVRYYGKKAKRDAPLAARAVKNTTGNEGKGWTVAGTEQSGGEHAGQNLEQAARERGILLEQSGQTVRTKDDLRKVVEKILRNPESGKVDKLTDRIWDRMQTEPEGTSMPRKEFFEFLYDKSFVNEANDIVRRMDKVARVGETSTVQSIVGDKGRYSWKNEYGISHRGGATPEEAQAEKPSTNGPWRLVDNSTPMHMIPLTDAIRASVTEGQPMYRDEIKGEITDDQRQEAVRKLHETIKRLGETLPNSVQASTAERESKVPGVDVLREVASVFGKRIVFLRGGKKLSFEGHTVVDQPNVIFLTEESEKPHLSILGHELVHGLRTEYPEVYEQFKSAMLPYLANVSEFKEILQRFEGRVSPDDHAIEEMLSNVSGVQFSNPKFWNALATKSPSLFSRVSNMVRDFIDRVLVRMNQRTYAMNRFVSDIYKARDTVAEAMRQYAENKESGVKESTRPGVELLRSGKDGLSDNERLMADSMQAGQRIESEAAKVATKTKLENLKARMQGKATEQAGKAFDAGQVDSLDAARDELRIAMREARKREPAMTETREGIESDSKRVVARWEKVQQAIVKLRDASEKAGQKDMKLAIRTVYDAIRDSLSGPARVRAMPALKLVKDAANLDAAMYYVREVAEEQDRRDLIAHILNKYGKIIGSPGVRVEFKALAKQYLSGIQLREPKAKQLERLQALRDYIATAQSQGINVDIPRYLLEQVARLADRPLSGMSTAELMQTAATLDILEDAGRRQFKTDDERRKQMIEQTLDRMEEKTVPMKTESRGPIMPDDVDTIASKFSERWEKAKTVMMKWKLWHAPVNVVMDMLDGSTGYDGWNYRTFIAGFNSAWNGYLGEKHRLFDEMSDVAKANQIKRKQAIRIGIYAVARQQMPKDAAYGRNKLYNTFNAADDIAKAKVDQMIDEITLTPEEQRFYDWMNGKLDSMWPRINDYTKRVWNFEIDKNDFYFPMITDWAIDENSAMFGTEVVEVDPSTGMLVSPDHTGQATTKTVKQDFSKSRKGAGEQKVQMDALKVMQKHFDDALYAVHMGEQIKFAQEVASSDRYREIAGDVGQKYVQKYLTKLARKGGTGSHHTIRALDVLRKNMGIGALGFNPVTVLVQFSSLIDGFGKIGAGFGVKGVSEVFTKEGRDFIKANMPEVVDRMGGDWSFAEVGKLGKAAYKGIGISDEITAGAVALGAYAKNLHDRGLEVDYSKPDQQAINDAQHIVNRTQATGSFRYQPMVVGEYGSISKAVYQFQTFPMNKFWYMMHDGITQNLKSGNWKQAAQVLFWAQAALLAEQGIRLGYAAMTGSGGGGDDDKEAAQKMASNILWDNLQGIPLFGAISRSARYGSTPIPILSAPTDFGKGMKSATTGAAPETRMRGAIRAMAAAGQVVGAPGVSAVSRLTRGWIHSDSEDIHNAITESAKRLPDRASEGRIKLESLRVYNQMKREGKLKPGTTPTQFRARYKAAFKRLNP